MKQENMKQENMNPDGLVLVGGIIYGLFIGFTKIPSPLDDIVRNDPTAKAGQFIGESVAKLINPTSIFF